MSERALIQVNTQVTEVISVFDANDNGVTGLLNSDFTKFLYKDGVANGTTVTVTEIANGQYAVTWTPTSTAYDWHLRISQATGNAYNKRGWQMTYTVTTDGVLTLAGIAALIVANCPTASAIASAVWGFVIESANALTFTATRMLRIIAAAVAGAKSTGSQTAVSYSDLAGDETMISGTANANGDRSSITYGP
jgi:hypothetical protein